MGTFELPVSYKGIERMFKSEFIPVGYVYKIKIDVNGLIVMFEPDEERNFRALIDPNAEGADKIDLELLQAIAQAIEQVDP